MRFSWLISAVCIVSGPALSETPLSGEEFDAYTSGRTITYTSNGQEFGAETYLRRQRVRWSFLQGACQDGYWYENGDEICFVYGAVEGPQCWHFFLTTNGLRAEFAADNSPPLFESPLNQDLICPGPEVGM